MTVNLQKATVLQDLITVLEAQLASNTDSKDNPMPAIHRLAAIELLAEFRQRCSSAGEDESLEPGGFNSSSGRAMQYNKMADDFLGDKASD